MIGLLSATLQLATVAAEPVEIRLIANTGVMISHGETRFLINPIFDVGGTDGFRSPPPELRDALFEGSGEYAGVDAALFTHAGEDQSDPAAIAAFMRANAQARVAYSMAPVSINLIQLLIPSADNEAGPEEMDEELLSRIVGIEPLAHEPMNCIYDLPEISKPLGFCPGGVAIWTEYANVAYVVSVGGMTIAHLGNANPDNTNWWIWDLLELGAEIDIVIHPYEFTDSEAGREAQNRRFARARWIAVGIPVSMSREDAIRQFGEGHVLIEPGETILLREAAE